MIHLINQDEHDERVINFNRGYGTITIQDGQKGLYLKEEFLGGYNNGSITSGRVTNIGTPNVVEAVKINSFVLDELEQPYSEEDYREYLENSTVLPSDMIEDEIAEWRKTHDYDSARDGVLAEGGSQFQNLQRTIAHELGHAVNITHHADDDATWQELLLEEQRGNSVAVQGGTWSGDVSCVMRYNCASEYLGTDGAFYDYPCEQATSGAACTFCTDKTGTDINAGGKVSGDASKGPCLKNVTLKGYFRDGN